KTRASQKNSTRINPVGNDLQAISSSSSDSDLDRRRKRELVKIIVVHWQGGNVAANFLHSPQDGQIVKDLSRYYLIRHQSLYIQSSTDGPRQYWYGYPHGYQHAAHHQSPGPQQYLDHTDAFPGWPHHHDHHYSHLQYQHHQAYHQQQQQSSQISAATDWSGDEANPVVVAGEPGPPITVSGSKISNPGTPITLNSPQPPSDLGVVQILLRSGRLLMMHRVRMP
ncbi:uncharacterized protein LOC143221988, partial [Lasioglossum baleicum]|uniref:uncharacterized protein LOC143221988 n=1 Tax=Lasioglossum baleicum TaxID=434251 RepID=UPI003FCE09FF